MFQKPCLESSNAEHAGERGGMSWRDEVAIRPPRSPLSQPTVEIRRLHSLTRVRCGVAVVLRVAPHDSITGVRVPDDELGTSIPENPLEAAYSLTSPDTHEL